MTLPADFHLSYSSLQQYLTCPRQWCFQRIDGVKKPVSGALFLGSTVHSALAYHFKNSPVVEETLLFFQQAWKDRSALKEDSWNGFIEWERSEQDLRDLGLELLQLYLKEVVPKLKPVLVEQEFTRSINGVPFIGRLDLVDQSGRVIDYKVKGRFWADPKVRARELALDLQPTAYGFLLGGPIEFSYHYLLKTKIPSLHIQTVRVPSSQIRWFGESLLPSVLEAILSGAFSCNPSTWHCSPRFCPYWNICRSCKN